MQKAIAWGAKKPTCPVRALKDWLDAAGIAGGPLFRTIVDGKPTDKRVAAKIVSHIVKRSAERAHLDAARFASHSLRSGHVTEAAMNGAADRDIMAQTGHRRVDSMHGYIKPDHDRPARRPLHHRRRHRALPARPDADVSRAFRRMALRRRRPVPQGAAITTTDRPISSVQSSNWSNRSGPLPWLSRQQRRHHARQMAKRSPRCRGSSSSNSNFFAGTIAIIGIALAEASGVKFLCPKCFAANNGPVGTHAVICWSRSRGVPDDATPGPGRWRLDGTGLHDLTLNADLPSGARSVLLIGGCGWHGFVTNGEAA